MFEHSVEPVISAEGRYVVFASIDGGLAPGAGNHANISGAPTLTGPDAFFVTATDVRSQQPGLLVLALGPAETPFAGGLLCLAPALIRTPFQNAGGNPSPPDCSGT